MPGIVADRTRHSQPKVWLITWREGEDAWPSGSNGGRGEQEEIDVPEVSASQLTGNGRGKRGSV